MIFIAHFLYGGMNMAYINKKDEKEHAFKRISVDLNEDRLPSVAALYGKEQYLVKWAMEQIIEKYVNPASIELDLSVIEKDNIDIDRIKEACETFSMMSAKRVVVLKDFEVLSGEKVKNMGEGQEEELIEYLQNVPEGCLLLMVASKADKKRKIYKAVEKYGKAYEFEPLNDRDLSGFIEKRLRNAGKKISPSVLKSYIQSCGYTFKESDCTLYNIENDINKMVAYSQEEQIYLSDVNAACCGNLETTVFEMLDAVSMGSKGEAYKFIDRLLNSGDNIFMIISLIASQFELILQVKELLEEGKTSGHIQKILKVHEFRIKKAIQFSSKYSIDNLRKKLIKIYEIEKNIKTGILEDKLALELFIAQI